MKNKKIIIGSRGSKLALIYAERARTEILKNPKIDNVEIKTIKKPFSPFMSLILTVLLSVDLSSK